MRVIAEICFHCFRFFLSSVVKEFHSREGLGGFRREVSVLKIQHHTGKNRLGTNSKIDGQC